MSTPVTLRGRLTADPDMKFSSSGKPFARFSVVTSRRFKNERTGDWEDRDTTFWECVAFGQLAENIAESLRKGTAVIVTGTAASEEWEDKNGQKRRTTKVTVEDAAPSLRWASAKPAQADRAKPSGRDEDPWANAPPF